MRPMRSRPPTIALVGLAAVCLLAAAIFVLRAGRGERGQDGGTHGDASGVERVAPRALDAGDDATATPESPAPPPRAAEAGTPAAAGADAEPVADARIEGLVLR